MNFNRDNRPKVPCQGCGKLVRRRPRMNKAKYPHKCPHGNPCPVGSLLYGTHANGPPTAHPMRCPMCPTRAEHDAIVAGLGRNPTADEIEACRTIAGGIAASLRTFNEALRKAGRVVAR